MAPVWQPSQGTAEGCGQPVEIASVTATPPSIGPPAAVSTLTPLQKRVWFLSGMGVFLDGFDLFIIGVALPLITAEFAMGDLAQGVVGGAAVLGAVIGAASMGRLADLFGRRVVFMVDLSLFVVFDDDVGHLVGRLEPRGLSVPPGGRGRGRQPDRRHLPVGVHADARAR